MVIEWLGLPGSGKTTLSKQALIIDQDRSMLVLPMNRAERLFWMGLFFCTHAILTVRVGRLIQQEPRAIRAYVRHLLIVSAAATIKAEALCVFYPDKDYHLDEGLLQRALSFSSIQRGQRYLELIAPIVDTHGVVVVLGGSFERFEGDVDRMNSPRILQGRQTYEAWKDVAIRLFEYLRSRPQRSHHVLTIDNRERPEIAKSVEAILAGLRMWR